MMSNFLKHPIHEVVAGQRTMILKLAVSDVLYIYTFLHTSTNNATYISVNFQSSLYRSLYRMILYMLSRKHSTISDQMSLLDALHCLTKNR